MSRRQCKALPDGISLHVNTNDTYAGIYVPMALAVLTLILLPGIALAIA